MRMNITLAAHAVSVAKDYCYAPVADAGRKRKTGKNASTVNMDRARTALPMVTTFFCSC